MHTLLWRTGPRRAFALAVVAVLLASHLPLLAHAGEAAALLLAVLAGRWLYGTSLAVWMLARVHLARFVIYGVMAVWLFVAIGGQPMEISYAPTAGNMAVAR